MVMTDASRVNVVDPETHTTVASATDNAPVATGVAADEHWIYSPVGANSSVSIALYPVDCPGMSCPPSKHFALPAPTRFRPTVVGSLVFVSTDDDRLTVFDPEACNGTCGPIASIPLSGTPWSSASIIDGHVYVPTDHGLDVLTLQP